MFCSTIMTHEILITHSSYKQLVTGKGLCILEYLSLYFLHLIFLLLKFTNHKTIVCRNHYYVVVWIFLQQKHKIKFPSNILRYIHDHLFIYFTTGIDSIYINLFFPISILLGQFTSIETSIKHKNKPFNTKKTPPIINFFSDPQYGFTILHINIMVDVSDVD